MKENYDNEKNRNREELVKQIDRWLLAGNHFSICSIKYKEEMWKLLNSINNKK